jgi:hypothetical protein
VYTGINYWVNLGISLVMVDLFRHGSQKGNYDKGVAGIAKALETATPLGKKNAKWVANIALGTFTLNSGGNLLVVPIKIAEDNKRKIVHWLNDKLGVDQTGEDGKKLTPEQIHIEEELPHHSWGKVIWRRVQGFLTTTTVGLTLDHFGARKLDKPITVDGELVTHQQGQDRFSENVVNGAKWALKYVPGGTKFANNPTAQRYMFNAALDSVYTYITSWIMRATNGAKKAKMPGEVDNSNDSPGVERKLDVITIEPNAPAEESKLDKFKTKAITPSENHVERTAAPDRSFTLAH